MRPSSAAAALCLLALAAAPASARATEEDSKTFFAQGRQLLDVAGHYGRPDVFQLQTPGGPH